MSFRQCLCEVIEDPEDLREEALQSSVVERPLRREPHPPHHPQSKSLTRQPLSQPFQRFCVHFLPVGRLGLIGLLSGRGRRAGGADIRQPASRLNRSTTIQDDKMFKKRVASKMRFGSLPAPRRGNGRLIVQK